MFGKFKSKKLLKDQKARMSCVKKVFERYLSLPSNPEKILLTLVAFFQDVSKIQDEGYFQTGDTDEYFPEAFKELSKINNAIRRAGREEYGMNRTIAGENVTSDKIFVGNIYGIWTNPVSEVIKRGDVMHYEMRKPVIEVIAEQQVRPFIYQNAEDAVRSLEQLLKIVATL
jgi:hypothetical protein